MHFTIFTLAIAIFWVGIFAKIVSLLRRQMFFLKYFSLTPLLIILFLCVLRLFLPVELPFTVTINSQTMLPYIQNSLYTPLLQFGNININLSIIIAFTWGAGTVSIILTDIRDYYRFKHLLDYLPITDDKQIHDIFSLIKTHGRLSKAKIIVHESVESPAIVGFINPVIILPDINFTDDELLGILIHETAHFKYCHNIIKFITEIIHACFWWNPMFKKLSIEIAHALELQSDKIVCRSLNKNQQRNYLLGIAKVVDTISNKNSEAAYSCRLIEEKNDEKLKQRFKMILGDFYITKGKRNLLLLPFIVMIFLMSYLIVLQPYYLPNQEAIGLAESIGSDCYLVETEHGYDLYDSNHNYIAEISYIDKSLEDLKIYKNLEDVE